MFFQGRIAGIVAKAQKYAAKLTFIAANLAVVLSSGLWLAVFRYLRGIKAEFFDCLTLFFVFESALLFFPTGKIKSTAG